MSEVPQWYVVHTYSGYENKVKANLEKIIENRNMQEQIVEVSVPTQNVVEIKNGVRKTVNRKVFPGYVLVNMHMNDETWYVVRNTRGVTSFVGPGSKPVPLSDEEIFKMGLIESETEMLHFAVGDVVRITTGPFEDSTGTIAEVNSARQMVVVTLSIFGRETPVELDYLQIERM
ncbi:MAG: transcription termination/antitermination protein NusG [Defluviitaleaceae bacterium]|nr:transcription termination/antitermination protein NusG [Defluviitaleaceae bacterium]